MNNLDLVFRILMTLMLLVVVCRIFTIDYLTKIDYLILSISSFYFSVIN